MKIRTDRITTNTTLSQLPRQDSEKAHGLETRMHGARDHATRVLVLEMSVSGLVRPRDDLEGCDERDALGFAEDEDRLVQREGERGDEFGDGDREEDVGRR